MARTGSFWGGAKGYRVFGRISGTSASSLTRSILTYINNRPINLGDGHALTPICIEVEYYEDAQAVNILNEEIFTKYHAGDYTGLKAALETSNTVKRLLTTHSKIYAFRVALSPGIYAKPWYVNPIGIRSTASTNYL